MPEEEVTLAEVPENLEEIEAEEGVNPYGESITEAYQEEPATESTESESIDYQAIASRAIDEYVLQSLSDKLSDPTEEETLSLEDIFLEDARMEDIVPAEQLRAGNPIMPEGKAYKLQLGNSEYYAWFPAEAELGVTDDGYIYNATGSNITGVIASSVNGISLTSYNDTVTIAPLLTGSGNNNAYRYGSRVYITDYYTNGQTLVNTTTYIASATVLEKPDPGYGLTKYQTIGIGLLLLLAVLMLLRGLWRDK